MVRQELDFLGSLGCGKSSMEVRFHDFAAPRGSEQSLQTPLNERPRARRALFIYLFFFFTCRGGLADIWCCGAKHEVAGSNFGLGGCISMAKTKTAVFRVLGTRYRTPSDQN